MLETVGKRAWGRAWFGSASPFTSRESLFHSWVNSKKTLLYRIARSLLCNELKAVAANDGALKEQEQDCAGSLLAVFGGVGLWFGAMGQHCSVGHREISWGVSHFCLI